jgi:DUF4097 and DUF4098 domain-containing protein YvlB
MSCTTPRIAAVAALAITIGGGLVSAGCDLNVGDGNFNIGLASGKATDTWTRTYTLSEGGTIEVVNQNGSITVEPSTASGQVEIRAERTARSSTDEAAKELLKKIEIREDVSATRVRVETHAPKMWGRDGHEVKYFVKAPAGVFINTRSTNGSLQLNSLPNDIEATTTNGGVKGESLSGHLEVTTTNGGLDVGLTAVSPKGVRLETTNGGISLTLPKTANADLSLQVTNGGSHVDDALPFTATGERTRRHVEGKLNAGGGRVELSTTNGGITVGPR